MAAGAEGRGLPVTLREVLAARLAHVSEPTMRLLGVAAVVGRKVDHDLLARLSEMSERELYDALEEAVAAQLLVVDESAVMERYEFRHALIAEAAAEAVLPSQRRRLHVTIAEALERMPARHGAEEAGHLAEIAHHWFEARDLPRALGCLDQGGRGRCQRERLRRGIPPGRAGPRTVGRRPGARGGRGLDRVELLRRTAHAGQLSGEFMAAAALAPRGVAMLGAAATGYAQASSTSGWVVRSGRRASSTTRSRRTAPRSSSCPTHRRPTGPASSPARPRCSCSAAGTATRFRSPGGPRDRTGRRPAPARGALGHDARDRPGLLVADRRRCRHPADPRGARHRRGGPRLRRHRPRLRLPVVGVRRPRSSRRRIAGRRRRRPDARARAERHLRRIHPDERRGWPDLAGAMGRGASHH